MDFAVLIAERDKLAAELVELENELETVRVQKREIAITRIRSLMNTYDLSVNDLRGRRERAAQSRAGTGSSPRGVRTRNRRRS